MDASSGLLVDYALAGEAIGVEITSPVSVTLEALNRVLSTLGQSALGPEDIAPFVTAA